MSFAELGKWLVVAGLGLALLGGVIWLLGHLPFLGNLPGDIRIQTQNVSCFIPIVSMIILSILATIILNVIIRIVNK
ncbi:MAG TPA: DUF2905 domain-containing protein [Anaerolineae bacterium]|nr:DUF2905 domain-containing protein [Anaerolineae bacterium]